MTQALGLLETVGFIPAVEAADAAAKGAEVTVHGLRYAGQGLVTVVIFGNISEVKAAIEAAEHAAKRLGPVRSSTTIGRVGDGITELLAADIEPRGDVGPDTSPAMTKMKVLSDAESLGRMTVTMLRRIARDLPGYPLGRNEIKLARKAELIDLITACNKS